MSLAMTLYLITVLSNLATAFSIIAFVTIFMAAVGTIVSHTEISNAYNGEEKEKSTKRRNWCFVALVVSLGLVLLCCLVPNKKTMYAMMVVDKVETINVTKELPEKTVKALDKLLDEYLAKEKD